MLDFDSRWRFSTPGPMPNDGVEAYIGLIGQVASQRVPKSIKERFKQAFCAAGAIPYYASSSDRFIDEDLRTAAYAAAANAPLFIDAFDGVVSELQRQDGTLGIPDDGHLNRLLAEHHAGFRIDRPRLVATTGEFDVSVATQPLSLDEQARNLVLNSLMVSERALAESRLLDAVQNVLWLLETFSTAFRNPNLSGGPIQQSYFNKIVYRLREKGDANGHQSRILDWMMELHGYLSAPAGGGIRHGTDLANGRPLDQDEARLFCNLARSYLVYLISEYERLVER